MDTNIISALGGGSGIDTKGIVKQLVNIERAPQQNRIDSKKEQLESQISAYGLLKSSLSEFKNIMAPLGENDTFNARSVSFPETDVITPNALDSNAQTGTFQIEVAKVAAAQSLATQTTYADKDAALNATGKLTIKLGTWSYDGSGNPSAFAENEAKTGLNVEVNANDSLQNIADKINAQDSAVQASVLLVNGAYQLMTTAPSGKANALEITADNASLEQFTFSAANFSNVTETQKGQDAELFVNGLKVFRETNEVSDVIQGLNFTLNKASPGEKFTFSVNEDKATAETAIKTFVEAYNTFYETAKSLVGVRVNPETNIPEPGGLSTDGSAKTLLSQIRSVLTASVPGVDADSNFSALTNIGIRTKRDGTLEITDDFSKAIKNNFEQIKNIFAPQATSNNPGVNVSMGNYAGKTVPGTYTGSLTAAPSKGSVLAGNDLSAVTFPLDTTTGDFGFKVKVDGFESGDLSLSGTFNTAEELRVAIQSSINNDSALQAKRAFVDVKLDNNTLQIVSRQYGADSKVSIESAGAEFTAASGLSTASAATAGTDASGSINGEAAFGSGDVLLPKINTDPYGLNISVKEDAALGNFSFSFSRGLAGELENLFNSFLKNDGAIKTREDNIGKQLDGLKDDQSDLDRRMSMVEIRLTQQYLAMEKIVSSLNTTSSALDGMLDRLPFTAKK